MCDISGHLLKMSVYRELILGASVELVFLDCHGLATKKCSSKKLIRKEVSPYSDFLRFYLMKNIESPDYQNH